MSDTTKSWLLRVCIVVIATLCTLLAVAVVDEIIDKLSQHWTGKARPNQIEVFAFCWLLVWRVWHWADRRVWIGSKSPT